MYDASEQSLIYKAMEPYWSEYGFDRTAFPLDWFYAMDDLRNYSYVFPFEKQLDRARFVIRSHDTFLLSILVSIIYIGLLFGGRKIMSFREPFELRRPLIVWNCLMTLFSMVAFVRVSDELFRVLANKGFVYSVCTASYGKDLVASFWITMFVRSKFLELLDTAFLVLRKKPIRFLHWYHHVTVLMFAWHSAKGVTAAGRWYAWMNFGVHSCMYGYYAASSMSYRPPRWISITVTTMQLMQMSMGIAINYTVFKTKTDGSTICHQSWANLGFAALVYVTFFMLFVHYFYDNYLRPKSAVAEKAKNEAGGERITKKTL